jgi:4-carboxymuconolactone decarboxylase
MDMKELYERGLKIRKEIFGTETVDKRMAMLGDYGAPLTNMINAYAYGDLWGRPDLSRKSRSLVTIAIAAATSRPDELRVHLRGALANGCTREEIREVLLHVAIYAGIPLSLEGHRAALEIFEEVDAKKK